ncbi:MAG: hypothetical protein U0797_30175 [Gemmataceae bacterium]
MSLCIDAHEQLADTGVKSRVVSMPSWELFENYCVKHPEYREQVLPAEVTARVSVEKASTFGWPMFVGPRGKCIGMKTRSGWAAFEGVAEEVRLHRRGGGHGGEGVLIARMEPGYGALPTWYTYFRTVPYFVRGSQELSCSPAASARPRTAWRSPPARAPGRGRASARPPAQGPACASCAPACRRA